MCVSNFHCFVLWTKPYILIKLIEKSNLDVSRNLSLIGGEVSKNVREILENAYLFPKIEVENDEREFRYQVLEEIVRLKE